MTAMEKAGVISSYFIWALLMALHSIQKGAWHQRAMATMWFNNLTWPTRPAFDCILQESQESQEASCLWHGRLKADIRGGKDISIACELRLLSRVSMNEGPRSTWKLMPKGSTMPMQWDTRRAAIFLNRKVSQELCDQSSTEKIGSCAASKPRGSWSFPTTLPNLIWSAMAVPRLPTIWVKGCLPLKASYIIWHIITYLHFRHTRKLRFHKL